MKSNSFPGNLAVCIFIWIFCLAANPVFAHEEAAPVPKTKSLEEKSLTEILEEEKDRKYLKIDDFLKDFDKGFSHNMGEKFEDLLQEEEFLNEDDEINTDSFETFNEEFDKIIEEDLADFELFEIDSDGLDNDFLLEEPENKPKASNEN